MSGILDVLYRGITVSLKCLVAELVASYRELFEAKVVSIFIGCKNKEEGKMNGTSKLM